MAVVAEGDIEVRLSPASAKSLQTDVTKALAGSGTESGAVFGKDFDKAADAALKKSGDSFKNIEKQAGKSGDASGKEFGKSFSGALTGVAAFSLIRQGVGFIKSSVAEFAEASRGVAQTNQVLKTTGSVANVSSAGVDKLAKSVGKAAAVDDDLVRSGANVLLTFTKVRNEVGKGNDIFNQGTKVALDMSTALGTDLQGSIIQVGKALNDPIKGITALSRVGVSFTEQQKDQIKTLTTSGNVLGAQKLILKELNTEFGGTAKAVADADGGVQRAAVSFKQLEEGIGGALAPALAKTTPLAVGLAEAVGTLPAGVTGAALGFAGLIASTAVVLKLRDGIRGTLDNLRDLGPAGQRAAGGLSLLGKLGATAAVIGLIDQGIKHLGESIESSRSGATVSDLAGDLADLASGAITVDEALKRASAGNSLLDNSVRALKQGLIGNIKDGLRPSADEADRLTTRLDKTDKALAELVQNGATKAAAKDLDELQKKFNIDDSQVQKVFNDYTNALNLNTSTAKVNKVAQDELQGGLSDTGGAADDATKDIDSLDKAIQYLSDTVTNSALGQFTDFESKLVSFRESQLRLGDALKDNGFNFDINTEKGIENRNALLSTIDAAQKYVDGLVETGKVTQNGAAYQDAFKTALKEVGDKFPQLRGEIDKYIAKLAEPRTELDLSTTSAQANIAALTTSLIGFRRLANQPGTTSIDFNGALGGNLPHKAFGGRAMANRPILVGDGGRTEVFAPDRPGTVYPSVYAAQQAGVGGGGGATFGDINVYEVSGDKEATAFAVMARIGADLNL